MQQNENSSQQATPANVIDSEIEHRHSLSRMTAEGGPPAPSEMESPVGMTSFKEQESHSQRSVSPAKVVPMDPRPPTTEDRDSDADSKRSRMSRSSRSSSLRGSIVSNAKRLIHNIGSLGSSESIAPEQRPPKPTDKPEPIKEDTPEAPPVPTEAPTESTPVPNETSQEQAEAPPAPTEAPAAPTEAPSIPAESSVAPSGPPAEAQAAPASPTKADESAHEDDIEDEKRQDTPRVPREEKTAEAMSGDSSNQDARANEEGASHDEEGAEDTSSSSSSSQNDVAQEEPGEVSNKEQSEVPQEDEPPMKPSPSKSQSIKGDIPVLSIPEPPKSPDMHSRGDSPALFERKAFNMFAVAPSPGQRSPGQLSPSLMPSSPRTTSSPRRLMVDKPRGAEKLQSPGIEKKWEDLGLEKMPWRLLEGPHFYELEYPPSRKKYFRRLPKAVSREKPTDEPLAPPSPVAHPLLPR